MKFVRDGIIRESAYSGDRAHILVQLDDGLACSFSLHGREARDYADAALSPEILAVIATFEVLPRSSVVYGPSGAVAGGGAGGGGGAAGSGLNYPRINGVVECHACRPPRFSADVGDLAEAMFRADPRVDARIRQQLGIRAPYVDLVRWERRALRRGLDGFNPERVWLIESCARAESVAALLRGGLRP